tara:strand:- start:361 stop:561 length:201 start_codon:yes stop_codon:yes gene_type:complete
MNQTVNMPTRQARFLKSDLCEGIKRCYVSSTYQATGKHPSEDKLNLYLDRVYDHFYKSDLLKDFNL